MAAAASDVSTGTESLDPNFYAALEIYRQVFKDGLILIRALVTHDIPVACRIDDGATAADTSPSPSAVILHCIGMPLETLYAHLTCMLKNPSPYGKLVWALCTSIYPTQIEAFVSRGRSSGCGKSETFFFIHG